MLAVLVVLGDYWIYSKCICGRLGRQCRCHNIASYPGVTIAVRTYIVHHWHCVHVWFRPDGCGVSIPRRPIAHYHTINLAGCRRWESERNNVTRIYQVHASPNNQIGWTVITLPVRSMKLLLAGLCLRNECDPEDLATFFSDQQSFTYAQQSSRS